MRVLLTGGAGRVGLPIAERLRASGYQVRIVGRRESVDVPGAEYMSCDICDYKRVVEVMKGTDAVIHLAAIPSPDKGAPADIYRINCSGTFNIYQAAVELSIGRVVTASSINALGYFYGTKGFPLAYLPVNEDHASFTTDAYSLSKLNVEELGSYFWQREGISGASLRIPWVYDPTEENLDRIRDTRRWAHRYLDPKFAMSAHTRLEFAHELEIKFQLLRDLRPYERSQHDELSVQARREIMADDEARLFSLRANLFANLDSRDSAQAFCRALTGTYEGYHTLFVNDSHNSVGLPAKNLARLLYPEVVLRESNLEGAASLVSIDRAREVLGFDPEFSLSRFSEE